MTGRYRVKGRIGEGGMGRVYVAVHEAIEKRVALKVLNREYSANVEVVERFKQEAISASRIKHPNVIDVFDFGQLEDGSCFIAMELLEGQDVGELLSTRGYVEPDEAIRILLQVAKALALGHSRGVVHRDLKPENVFLQNTPEGERIVKIVDFGIAQLRGSDEVAAGPGRQRRLTKTGMIFGTPEYMAPEQAKGLDVDSRTDIYAAGVILYELLSGGVPFGGESFLDVLNQHVLAPVPPLTTYRPDLALSDELEAVLLRMLEKNPEDRFQNMKEVARALLATPEGRELQAQLSQAGADIDLATDLLSSTESTVDSMGRRRSARTASGHPPPILEPEPARATVLLGSRDRTPPGREVVAASERRSRFALPRLAGIFALVVVTVGGAAWVAAALAPTFGLARPARSLAPQPAAGEAPKKPTTEASSVRMAASSQRAAPLPKAEEVAPPAASNSVKLRVVTEPEAAVLFRDDFQVCDRTPCEIEVEPGAAVSLLARKGSAVGVAKVRAQTDQTVSVPLKAPVKKAPSTQQLCEVNVDGLKILRPCQ